MGGVEGVFRVSCTEATGTLKVQVAVAVAWTKKKKYSHALAHMTSDPLVGSLPWHEMKIPPSGKSTEPSHSLLKRN